MDDVTAFCLARVWVFQQDTHAIQRVAQHNQSKEGIGDASCGFPLELQNRGGHA